MFKKSGVKTAPEDVTALIGRHNLEKTDEKGSLSYSVSKIVIHPDYSIQSEVYDADIAIVVLKNEVDTLQGKIRGVCIPPQSDMTVSGFGTVAGWGYTEEVDTTRKKYSVTPYELDLPVVTNDECFEADPRFFSFSSKRTFCAGFLKQDKAVCKGDSGGGFYVYNIEIERYQLIGIVSSSIAIYIGCRTDTFSVFTDVSKHSEWIIRTITEKEDINQAKWIYVDFRCEKK